MNILIANVAGIDLTNPEFFRTGLEAFAKEIDEFIALSQQIKQN